MQPDSALIEASELAALLETQPERIRIFDASYALSGPSPRELFGRERIGHAAFFDIDEIADRDNDLAHMLPTAEEFATAMSALGVSSGDLVIVYDRTGMSMAASRAWWMFRVFSHDNVRVLNGGLPYWKAQGFEVNTAPPVAPALGRFKAAFRPGLVRNMTDIMALLDDAGTTIMDARSAERFSGQVAEPRPGLRAGHIPGSCNLPFMSLIDTTTGRLKERAALEQQFSHVNTENNLVASCGSGVTACVVALALYELGHRNVAVYDGSWTEWGRESAATPVEQAA